MNIARDFADQGGGVVAVMHDLNLTAMFSDKMVLMANGNIEAAGPVAEVLTNEHLSSAYGCSVVVNQTPNDPVPFILPQAAVA
jgi:iron complex transport system ATP-binding protein